MATQQLYKHGETETIVDSQPVYLKKEKQMCKALKTYKNLTYYRYLTELFYVKTKNSKLKLESNSNTLCMYFECQKRMEVVKLI